MNMIKTLGLVLALSSFSVGSSIAQEYIRVPVTEFDPERIDDIENPKWSVLTLPKRSSTDYKLVEMENYSAIKASSINSASGLVYKVNIDPKEYPVLEWSWKVDSVLEKGDYTKKKGDDYPARIYITFDYDRKNLKLVDKVKYAAIKTFTRYEIPLRALNYVWANKAEIGTIAPNAYTNWVYMVAAESGDTNTGVWKMEMRNIYQDYKDAFGEEPPRITGVAIMTDSDNTKESAEAYYGDIVFKSD